MFDKIRIDRNVEMKTRDGVVLRADVYRPDIKSKVPAIVCRTPYDKDQRHLRNEFFPSWIANANGFAFVYQDTRGRYTSDGEWSVINPVVEMPDGFDTIEWVASEPWCDGNVGMLGASYESLNQFSAALQKPRGLKALAPQASGYGERGVLSLHFFVVWGAMMTQDWLARSTIPDAERRTYLDIIESAMRDPVEMARHLPLSEHPLVKIPLPGNPFGQLMAAMDRGLLGFLPFEDVEVPALFTTGYYDMGSPGAVDQFRRIRDRSPNAHARSDTKMIIGPWKHGSLTSNLGEAFFGLQATPVPGGVQDAHLRYFSRQLRGDDVEDLPTVRYFLMGTNEWRDVDEWPPPGVVDRHFFLRSDGALSDRAPDGAERPDSYRYDPNDPVIAYGGRYFWGMAGMPHGPLDQARIESRPDVLTYTTEPVDSPLVVAGNLSLRLFVSSSAPETDFAAKVCDVDRDGISLPIAEGLVRTRWRDANSDGPSPHLEPGEVYELDVKLGPTGHVFLPGHRVRVQITSSCFPWVDRNMNTGNPLGSDASGVVAEQAVHHSAGCVSYVVLPVIA